MVSDNQHIDAVHAVLKGIPDPELPCSIVELGLVEEVRVEEDGRVHIVLLPTFSGCPALSMIANDVRSAIADLDGVTTVDVRWLGAPVWTIDRVTDVARATMAREFTVAVRIGREPVSCPRCGSSTMEDSMFGPSRCRAVHVCTSCAEVVEVMRA